jgi:hypothetical protein
MAVGSYYGDVVVFGDKGVETYFEHSSPSRLNPIKYLEFKQGDGLLISIDSSNTMVGWNLVRQCADYETVVAASVSCLHAPTGMKLVFVGCANGNVFVYDGERGGQPVSIITPIDIFGPKAYVVSCSIHPQQPNMLLIAFAQCGLMLWDLRESAIWATWKFTNLTCVSWKTDGTHFVCGFEDGRIGIWNVLIEQRPSLEVRLDDQGSDSCLNHEPVTQVHWISEQEHPNDACIMVIGGNAQGSQTGIRFLRYTNADLKQPVVQNVVVGEFTHITICALLPNDAPWYNNALDPAALILLDAQGILKYCQIEQEALKPIPLIDTLEMSNSSKITAFALISNWSEGMFLNLLQFQTEGGQEKANRMPMVCGGIKGSRIRYLPEDGEIEQRLLTDILITTNEHGSICLWDAASELCLLELDTLRIKLPVGTIVDQVIPVSDGRFALMLSNGHVLFYQFLAEGDKVDAIDSGSPLLSIHQCSEPGFAHIMTYKPGSEQAKGTLLSSVCGTLLAIGDNLGFSVINTAIQSVVHYETFESPVDLNTSTLFIDCHQSIRIN